MPDIEQHTWDTFDLHVGFNFKFELHWYRRLGFDVSGAKVWDCQIAEFIIRGQTNPYPSLNGTAAAWGLGEDVPESDLITVDGSPVAAIHMLPFSFKGLEKKRKTHPAEVMALLNKYLRLGILHKWAVLDWVLGNPDRHGQNLMTGEGKLKLIDHGSAFAGMHFDPGHDQNSFIPFYLRAWAPEKFNGLTSQEKMTYMPRLSDDAERAFKFWVQDLDEDVITNVCKVYGIHPDACIYRLSLIKMASAEKDLAILKLWLGLS